MITSDKNYNDNISIIDNQNSLVILIDKIKLNPDKIEMTKRFFLSDDLDLSHIPFVYQEEQEEIEEILKNTDTQSFVSMSNIWK